MQPSVTGIPITLSSFFHFLTLTSLVLKPNLKTCHWLDSVRLLVSTDFEFSELFFRLKQSETVKMSKQQITFFKSRERDRFLDFLGKAEGRDKFGKTVRRRKPVKRMNESVLKVLNFSTLVDHSRISSQIQFIARCLSGIARDHLGQKELGQQLENFWRAMLDARRMHWFGKSFAELRTVESTLDTFSLPPEVRYAHACARFFFALRWAIENCFILIKLKVG